MGKPSASAVNEMSSDELLELLVENVDEETAEEIMAIEDDDERKQRAAEAVLSVVAQSGDNVREYQVLPYFREIIDLRTGDHRQVQAGWILQLTENDIVRYAGVTLCWVPWPRIRVPFETKEAAEASARADFMLRAASDSPLPVLSVRNRRIEIPIAEVNGSPGYQSPRVDVRLNDKQSSAMASVRTALRQGNALLESGIPVSSNADVIRWLMEQIAK